MLSGMTTTPVTHTPVRLDSARTYAIAMQKGGVGKTTTTVNLGYALHALGYRVLVIDLDPQCNASTGFNVEATGDDGTVYEVLTPEKDMRMELDEVIQESAYGVDVAPSAKALRKLEQHGLGAGGEARLGKALSTVKDRYDFILIDCPPALGHMTMSAFAAANDVIAVVSPTGPDEIEGLLDLADSVEEAKEFLNPALDVRHIVLANYDGRTTLAKDIKRALKSDWADEYLGEISHSIRVGEAKARRQPIAIHAADYPSATDYADVAERLVDRIGAR